MKSDLMSRRILTLLLAVVLLAEAVAIAPPAEAGAGPLNLLIGGMRMLNALNRRNRVYNAARDTQRDFNAYYESLTDTAHDQLLSGELESLREGADGPERVRLAAFIKLSAALQAEHTAVTQAIEAEKNQARQNFNSALVRELQSIIIKLPGAQTILSQVRQTISQIRATVIALQAAAAGNRPTDVLSEQLAQQVQGSAYLQNVVRNLGSSLAPGIDRSLGGALTQVDQAIENINQEANQALDLLNSMDSEVAQYDFSQAEASGQQLDLGLANVRLTDRASALIDVASQALAFLSAAQGTGGTTREQLYTQIRQDLLSGHNAQLMDAIQQLSLLDCRAVSWSEYEAAMTAIGKSAGQAPAIEAGASYMVCIDKESGEPVHGWPLRVTATGTTAAAAAGSQAQESGSLPEEPLFTLADCGCGIPVAFDEGASTASKRSTSWTTATGSQFESMQRLNCEWSQPYTSAEVTARTWFNLDLYALPAASQGQALFSEAVDDVSAHLPYCEQDHTCTPELHDSSGSRYFHVEKNIYEKGGQHLPSAHFSYLVNYQSVGGVAYVLEITGNLPERDPGDDEIVRITESIESCALDVIGR